MLSAHRAAVLGSPVRHSLSPVLHRAAYQACGLTDWGYGAHEVKADNLPAFLGGLGPEWAGLSLTMPLKEVALEVADECSPLALRVGAANTLLRVPAGWRAENTDVEGVRGALADGLGAQVPRSAAVLGSGATARSVLAALDLLGVRDVVFVVRDQVRESTLAQARDHGMTVHRTRLGEGDETWASQDLLVSTSPPSGSGPQAQALPSGPAPAGQLVLDVVYDGWPTPFAAACHARGARVVSGMEMLVHQAAEQFTLMTGVPAPLDAMQRAGRTALGH